MKKSKTDFKKKGNWGEGKAKEFLLSQGIRILSSNIRTEFGEIDLLGLDGDMVVFIEVKTRFSKQYGFPEISVDNKKSDHMIKSALRYLQDHPEMENDWRIDVISITNYKNEKQEIKWFKNAIIG